MKAEKQSVAKPPALGTARVDTESVRKEASGERKKRENGSSGLGRSCHVWPITAFKMALKRQAGDQCIIAGATYVLQRELYRSEVTAVWTATEVTDNAVRPIATFAARRAVVWFATADVNQRIPSLISAWPRRGRRR